MNTIDKYISDVLYMFLDIPSEVVVIAVVVYVIVAPQIISYFLGGIFGCASKPRFLSALMSFTVLATVKTLSFVSGVAFAAAFAVVMTVNDPNGVLQFVSVMIISAITISAAFVILAVYYRRESIYAFIVRSRWVRAARPVHQFLTRHMMLD